ncbi:tetratricopeptide repeat-containing protein [Micromonospora tarensis]|nr:tetratricopeptide repeat-containing protein [Micromonospora tarensis]
MTLLGAAPDAVADSLRPVVASPMRLYQTATRLGDLVRLSQRGIQVHRLVQTLVLSQLAASSRDELRRQAGGLVAASHPGEPASASTWPAWSTLLPHLLALELGETDDRQLRDAACDAMLYLLYSGNTDAGFRLARHLFDQWRQKLGPDDPHTLTAASELAHAYHNQGRDREALDLTEDTLTRRQRTLGPDDPATLRSASDYSIVIASLGRLAEGIDRAKDVLARRIKVLGGEHRDTLITRGQIASWKGETGDHQTAITAYEELLTDRLRILGPDHPDTLTTRANLASWKGEAGDHHTAITAFEELLTDQLRILGPNHPDTLKGRGNLAHALLVRGALLAARAQATAKLEAERRLFGLGDRRTQETQKLLNEIKRRMGGRSGPSNGRRKKR